MLPQRAQPHVLALGLPGAAQAVEGGLGVDHHLPRGAEVDDHVGPGLTAQVDLLVEVHPGSHTRRLKQSAEGELAPAPPVAGLRVESLNGPPQPLLPLSDRSEPALDQARQAGQALEHLRGRPRRSRRRPLQPGPGRQGDRHRHQCHTARNRRQPSHGRHRVSASSRPLYQGGTTDSMAGTGARDQGESRPPGSLPPRRTCWLSARPQRPAGEGPPPGPSGEPSPAPPRPG